MTPTVNRFGNATTKTAAIPSNDLQRGTTFAAPSSGHANELIRTRETGDKVRKDMLAEVM